MKKWLTHTKNVHNLLETNKKSKILSVIVPQISYNKKLIMYKLVTTNPMTNKTRRLRLRLVRSLMDGMMNSNTLGMIISWKKSSRKRLLIKSNNSSKSHKTKIGGELSEMNSTRGISNSPINNWKSLTESEVEKWHPRPLLLLITHTNFNITTPCHYMPIHQARKTSCHQNGSKWKSIKFSMVYWVEE